MLERIIHSSEYTAEAAQQRGRMGPVLREESAWYVGE